MSSYITKVIHKKTGKIHEAFCIDDYFGKYNYGYKIDGSDSALTEKQFRKEFKTEK